MDFVNPNPRRLSLMSSSCQNFPSKIFLEPTPSSTSSELVSSLSPPWSLHAVVESSPESPRCCSRPQLSPFARRHVPRPELVMSSIAQSLSPSPRRHPRAHNNVVLRDPMTPSTCAILGTSATSSSRACDAVVPAMPQSPRRRRTRAVPEPAMPSSSPNPQGYNIVYFLCHFGPTNPDFDMLHCHIALICYISFVPLHCFDVLHCHIALICYITFNMCISLICYIATLF
jgi:hypothetical protein